LKKATSPPVACDLSAFDPDQNKSHEALLNELFTSIQTTRELADGYELSLDGDDQKYLRLARLVTLERLCCPFLNFQQGYNLDGKIWLRLTGDNNAKQFLKTYLHQ